MRKPERVNGKYWNGALFNTDLYVKDLEDYAFKMEQQTEQLNILHVSQQSELLKALNGIIQCCDGNDPATEQIYHIAKDTVKAFNCA